MSKVYADLHLRVNTKDPKTLQSALKRASDFGYKLISIPFTSDATQDQINLLKAACKEVGLDFVLRADIRPRNQNELMTLLRRLRRKFEVICVLCDDKEVARQAAKDRRVDLLNFPSLDYRKRFFDRAEAELASSGLAALEVDVKPLLVLSGPARIRLLSSLRREVATAKEFHVPLLVSSGVEEERYMRMPKDMASLGYLFGLNEESALKAVCENPSELVLRNREKLSARFVAPGIRIVKEGSDC
jgi:ribonuclease P/MRP protein subunit RPP1